MESSGLPRHNVQEETRRVKLKDDRIKWVGVKNSHIFKCYTFFKNVVFRFASATVWISQKQKNAFEPSLSQDHGHMSSLRG